MSLLINQPLPGVQHGPTPGGVDSTPTAGVTADPMRAAIATHFRPGGQQSVHASETPARQSPPGLAKTTTDLALAPRLGAEGKLFARAENLVANVLDGEIPMRQGMRELQALRHEAIAATPGDQNTKAAFNALCTTLVLSPLKNAGLAQNPAMARALEFTLHAQLDRVLEADSPEILDQARTEIEATRRLFQENGRLGADQALAIETLQEWIETKALALTAIDTLAPRVAARQTGSGHEPLATVLDAATTLRADLVSSRESSTVPLRDMALTVLSPRVDQQIAALEDLSTARYAPLDEEGQNLLRETRSVTVDNHVQAPPAAHVEAHDAAVT
ncbi:MAG: hypothetical protein EOL86_14125, partial [Deltaproteobacteria bacterium]|nr:hypothetical protein [Deltaproteobacteria bacterium]